MASVEMENMGRGQRSVHFFVFVLQRLADELSDRSVFTETKASRSFCLRFGD